MNYRVLLDYGYCEDDGTYTVVLDKNKLSMYKINLEEKKEEIKAFFKADTIEVNRG